MRILVVADWHGNIYGEAFFNSFKVLGHETFKFGWKEYFHNYQYADRYKTDDSKIYSYYFRIQNKFLFGPALKKLNKDLVKTCSELRPDLVFIYRGTHIRPSTIKTIKTLSNCKVFGYNNDDPFSLKYHKYVWRHYVRSIPFYDHIFSYRLKNIRDYNILNYKRTSLLRSYYLANENYHISKLTDTRYKCDIIFIGHFEDDGRDETIKHLIENNINIKLYGSGWELSKHFPFFVKLQGDVKPLYEDYNLALNSAKIALVFLSKLNNDTYTRRCFEITATKTMMMAEYTDDLADMFNEGIEAEYFNCKQNLLAKLKYYLNDNERINEIANAGYSRLLKDGHEVGDRAKQVVDTFNNENSN